MLTRLKVSGFKNLVDVDVRFGPFTCVAGVNGSGKSNLFDAIQFLSALADQPLVNAATSVRSGEDRTGDVRSLFHCVGDSYANEMAFEVEMIVPQTGVDDLGQKAEASITSLRYSLTLAYRGEVGDGFNGGPRTAGLEIIKEELVHITQRDASRNLLFDHKPDWRKSVIQGQRRAPHFISTDDEHGNRRINQHQDGGSSGRPLPRLAANLPRTVLSVANASESPTAFLARYEMRSWRLLQLEPSSLRRPDAFSAPTQLGADGSHLAATLYRLARSYEGNDAEKEASIYGQVANSLSQLIDDVYDVWVDRDEKRELYTLKVTDRNGTAYAARSLSDGTLRFLALAVLELDPQAQGLICLEEPENGIHPERIPAILELLQSIATDPTEPVGEDNPLRQVIINTHSPSVVQQVPDESLLVARLREIKQAGQRYKRVQFSCLQDTWRSKVKDAKIVSKGDLLAYLNPVVKHRSNGNYSDQSQTQRVVDRQDLQPLLPGFKDME